MNPHSPLFSQIASGDEKAFAELYNHYSPVIYLYTLRIVKDGAVAQEKVQDVFLQVWLTRTRLLSVAHPSAWLYKIACNICFNHIRSTTNQVLLLSKLSDDWQTYTPVEETFDARQLQLLIQKGIRTLPRQRRLIYTMSREEHLSRKEIALRLHISENAVRNQLSSAVEFLQNYLVQQGGISLPGIFF